MGVVAVAVVCELSNSSNANFSTSVYPNDCADKVLAKVTASFLSIPAIFDNCSNSEVSSRNDGFRYLFELLKYQDSLLAGSFCGEVEETEDDDFRETSSF